MIQALPQQIQSRYPLGEVTIELDIDTINHIIDELTTIGKKWIEDTKNDSYSERKQIMAYLLKQWITVGDEATRVSQANLSTIH